MGRRERDRQRNGMRQADVLCPFFKNYWRGSIKCEGFMDGCSNTVTFIDKDDHARHMDVFCQKHYKNCEIYRMVMAAKYEEDT